MMMMRGAFEEDLKNSVPSFARGLPILLVDHDIFSLISISLMLQSYSLNVITAQSTTVATSMIRDWNWNDQDHRFKLIMAHLSMAKPEDLSFLRALVKKGIPLILISSDKNVTTAEKALAEGACFFLEKPIGVSDLKYVWQYACQRRTTTVAREDRPVEMKWKINTNDDNCNKTITDPNVKDKKMGMVADGSSMRNVLEPSATEPKAQKHVASNSQKAMKRPLDGEKDRMAMMNKKLYDRPAEKADSRKRKVPNDGEENGQSGEAASGKKPRIFWTTDLHFKFTSAVSTLGDQMARPKAILQMMNVPNLTARQVASHLQKYKAQVQRIISSVGTDDAASSKEYLGSHVMPASSQWFDKSRMSLGRESFGFGSGETPSLCIPPFASFVIRDDGYLYQDLQQPCCFPKPTEPSLPQSPPSSPIADAGEKQSVSEANGSRVSSPESNLTKTSSPVAIEDDMDFFSDLASVLSPMHELPISMDTEPRYRPSQLWPEQLSNVPTENSTKSVPACPPNLASGIGSLQERSLNTDHLIGETSEGYSMNSSRSTNCTDFLKPFSGVGLVENSKDFDEILKMLEDEPQDLLSPEGKLNLGDVNQYSQWLEEVLVPAPTETESYLHPKHWSKL